MVKNLYLGQNSKTTDNNTQGRPKVILYANKQKDIQVNKVFILLNVLNNPHGCLYIVAYVLNIFEKI